MIARSVLTLARDRHPAFNREDHPDATLLRRLSSEQKTLLGRTLLANPAAVVSTETIALSSYDFDTGATNFPAHVSARTGEAVYESTGEVIPCVQVNPESKHHPLRQMAYYIEAGVLFLVGEEEDWQGFESVRIPYTPAAADLTTLAGATGTLVLPDSAEAALAANLADFMAGRCTAAALERTERLAIAQEKKDREAEYLDTVRRGYKAKAFITRERT